MAHLVSNDREGPVFVLLEAGSRVHRDALADVVRCEAVEVRYAVLGVLSREPAFDHGHAVLRQGAGLVRADVGRVAHRLARLTSTIIHSGAPNTQKPRHNNKIMVQYVTVRSIRCRLVSFGFIRLCYARLGKICIILGRHATSPRGGLCKAL